ncbi:DUF5696 domain-containing protein [Paenibacillus arenilitoris]|uniref:Alpha-galactosidase n=1 Tax=Paenibacillus arenilitoris TaxID=2772299 RepID=A0A927CJD6_9BACL|nr:DUF5696 domain-containing protein [Paenibacillus arenilitoris]MBD2867802.1 hypothetical protein [Paenibacillus arenilitoris]
MIRERKQNRRRRGAVILLGIALAVSALPFTNYAEEAEEQTETAEREVQVEPAGAGEQANAGDADPAAAGKPDDAAAGSGASPRLQPQRQAGEAAEVELLPVAATKKAAENDAFELYIDEASGNVRVVDKRSGNEWLGSPQADKLTLPNNKKFMDSPLHITYTDGSSISETYTLKDKANTLAFAPIENGVRVTFGIEEIKLTVAVEYTLTDDGFEALVPDDSIKEEGAVRLTKLEVLPFFHAAHERLDEGAVFLPDGSGALMTVKAKHPQYFNGYSEPVYGPDHAFRDELGEVLAEGLIVGDAPKERIALPVFGIYRSGTGFLAILTEGEETAYINATPAGVRNIPFYRAGAEFVYRSQDVIFIGSSGQIPLFQAKRTNADRRVKYVLLEGEKAHYVGMAEAYRRYLQDHAGLVRQEAAAVPLHIRLMGGIMRDEIVGSTFIAMTTFEEASVIIDDYAERGIEALKITFAGWSENGLYGRQPDHFPVEGKLGGRKELEELIAHAKAKGVELYLDVNYVRPFQGSGGSSSPKDAIKGIDREAMDSPNYHVSSRLGDQEQLFHLLKPGRAAQFAGNELDDFKKLGVSGLHASQMGELLYSDQDAKHPASRKQTKEAWVSSLDRLREAAGRVSVDYGYAYALGHVDSIVRMPMDSSHFVYLDETVPFYQIVVHGMVPYAGAPANLRNDAGVELLRAIEYGASPSFELTYEPTELLKRTMEDRLFSSSYRFWFERSIEEYERFRQVQRHTLGQPIVGHERVQPKVYRTTYGNGTEVIVNYGRKPAVVDGTRVEGLGYAVREGGTTP